MATAHITDPKLRYSTKTKIASWNIQGGIRSADDADTIIKDMTDRRINIACLQETRCGQYDYTPPLENKGRIICLEPEPNTPPALRYGQGFFISSEWLPNFWGIKRISNRISVIYFILNTSKQRRSLLTIINVYAPHSLRTQEYPEETEAFYDQLQDTYQQANSRSSLVILAGDFNSKLGKSLTLENETFIGRWGNGSRNTNGIRLAEFLSNNRLFACNTAFHKDAHHITTWTGKIHIPDIDARSKTTVYNQIDYIMVKQGKLSKLVTDSYCSHGHIFNSDHGIVIATFNFSKFYKLIRLHTNKSLLKHKLDLKNLSSSHETQLEYQNRLSALLFDSLYNNTNDDDMMMEYDNAEMLNSRYSDLTKCIITAAEQTIPVATRPTTMKINYIADSQLTKLKTIRQRLINRLKNKSPNNPRLRQLRKRRTFLGNQIKKRVKQLHNDRADLIATELEQNRSNCKSFYAARILKKCSPGSMEPFTLIDDQNVTISHPTRLIESVNSFYKEFYNQRNVPAVPSPWIGEARPLDNPITAEEIHAASKKLNNGRATGIDQISAEFIKYAPNQLHQSLANIINDIFTTHTHLDALGAGILIPLNKPGKPKKAANTRPITLLNSIRKTLSLVLLERIYPAIDNFVSQGQSGFRRKRSTTDVLWSYRWLAAITQKYKVEAHVLGIDLSKAFDCINRTKLLEAITPLISNSDLRILTYLMSHTSLQARIQGHLGEKFDTTIGTPQGDALSPLLFIFYLEVAIRQYRAARTPQSPDNALQMDLGYADDQDFVSGDQQDLEETKEILPPILLEFNFIENADKREEYHVTKETYKALPNKKLGSKISDKFDIKHRISQAAAAFSKFWKLWLNTKKIKLATRIRMYNAFILPILTYNVAPLALTPTQARPLDVIHRRHLRHILRSYYPNIIHNRDLYIRCKTHPISYDLLPKRWQLFGHILRGSELSPSNQLMNLYFKLGRTPNQQVHRGGCITTLPSMLNKDLQLINRYLSTTADFVFLQTLAQNRTEWRRLWQEMSQLQIQQLQEKETQRHNRLHNNNRTRQPRRTIHDANIIEAILPLNDPINPNKRIRLTLHPPLILNLRRRNREEDNNYNIQPRDEVLRVRRDQDPLIQADEHRLY